MKNAPSLLLLLALLLSSCRSHESVLTHVNPLIGTGGLVLAYPGDSISYDKLRDLEPEHPFGGLSYPGAVAPFGMIQLSPDCHNDGFGWSAGYHISDRSIKGFSHMHTSGNGRGFGHFLFMPSRGKPTFHPGSPENPDAGYRSRFSHDKEEASPGYYGVRLLDTDIQVELTATERAGFHRYVFPDGSEKPHVILDLSHGLGFWEFSDSCQIRVVNEQEISGFRMGYKGIVTYFHAQFSQPWSDLDYQADSLYAEEEKLLTGKNLVAAFEFEDGQREVLLKLGLSFTSPEDARNNLLTEIPHWDFKRTLGQTRTKWERELGAIRVKGGDENSKTCFYTALYHASLTPFLFNDADGSFLASDGKIRENEGFVNYTYFSLWDTYRTLHPLLTILQPERVDDMMNSMLMHANTSPDGLLPLWCLATHNNFNMAGYSSAPVLAEAAAKGFTAFDARQAYALLVDNALNGGFAGREAYAEQGYVPSDVANMNVPKTLEYAFCDWNIAALGSLLEEEAWEAFMESSKNYKNTFDQESGFFRPRLSNGSWKAPFDPRDVSHQFPGEDYMESNAWQYNWHVMHDVEGMIGLMGGADQFCLMLDSLFDQETYLTGSYAADVSGLVGQYAQGNQPVHHVPYLYTYAGQAWKTQERVREIMEKTYSHHPDGLPGNDDGGEMSAWYLFGALGFYPVNPAEARYVIGVPAFDRIVMHLQGGQTFTIHREGYGTAHPYVQEVWLNDQRLQTFYLEHSALMAGGELRFVMGPDPKNWYHQ